MKKTKFFIELFYIILNSTFVLISIFLLYINIVLTIIALVLFFVLTIGYGYASFKNKEMAAFFVYGLYILGFFCLFIIYIDHYNNIDYNPMDIDQYYYYQSLAIRFIIIIIIAVIVEILFTIYLAKTNIFRKIFGIKRKYVLSAVEMKPFWYGTTVVIIVFVLIIIFLYSIVIKYYGSFTPPF